MKTRRIKTLVKGDHTLGKDQFVLGRIMGAMAVMCKEDPAMGLEFGRDRYERGNVFMTETTDEKYAAFVHVVESWYAGLCVFDYVE